MPFLISFIPRRCLTICSVKFSNLSSQPKISNFRTEAAEHAGSVIDQIDKREQELHEAPRELRRISYNHPNPLQ